MKESVAIAVANECGTGSSCQCGRADCSSIVQELYASVECDDYFHAESVFRNYASEMDSCGRRRLVEAYLAKLEQSNLGSHVGHVRFAGHLYKICGEWQLAKSVLQQAGALL